MSIERHKMLTLLGAELMLTPATDAMKDAIARAEEIARTTGDTVIRQQFKNPANPPRFTRTTAEEIWKDMGGKATYLLPASVPTPARDAIPAGISAETGALSLDRAVRRALRSSKLQTERATKQQH
jgi:hypothetical protein